MKTVISQLNRLNLLGVAAILFFFLSSCNGGREVDDLKDVGYDEEVALEAEGVVEDEVPLEAVNNEGYFNSWDADNDMQIGEAEWKEGERLYLTEEENTTNLFYEWDLDRNESLNVEEFTEGMYDYYDKDNDGIWDEEEFIGFSSAYYYHSWDVNYNEEVEEKEFEEGWTTYLANYSYDDALFAGWDVDSNATLDKGEFAEGMFDYWDKDDTGYIEGKEFAMYTTFR